MKIYIGHELYCFIMFPKNIFINKMFIKYVSDTGIYNRYLRLIKYCFSSENEYREINM